MSDPPVGPAHGTESGTESDRATGRIVFDTIAAGGGHVATARALAQAVERAGEGRFACDVRDAMDHLGLHAQDRRHKRSWSLLLRVPPLVRWGQRALDAVPRLAVAAQRRALDETARRAAADLERNPADLVVVNHGWLMTAYARARLRYGLRVPVLTFATEPFDASALWADPDAARVVAPSAAARSCLIRLGVPAGRIDQLGYPVARAFLDPPRRTEARATMGLGEGPLALLSLGGEGVAPGVGERGVGNRIAALRARRIHVWAIVGRNDRLGDALRRRFATDDGVRIEGFTLEMPTRIAAADVVMGKAGPASVMEALAGRRPFLVASHAGLNELAVTRFLEDRRLGGRIDRLTQPSGAAAGSGDGADSLASAAADAISARGEFEGVQRRLARLPFRDMAGDLGRHVLACAERRAPPAPLIRVRPGWDEA